MRINQYLARHTDLSRRNADAAVSEGRVEINGLLAKPGDTVIDSDLVTLDGRPVQQDASALTIMLNKPVGYVVSRNGQGNHTIYDLLPSPLQHLNPIGRLDKLSSGLLLMTNDGNLAQRLTHPKYEKQKTYLVNLSPTITREDFQRIDGPGIMLEDGISRLGLKKDTSNKFDLIVTMHEGRNRQIRRTFAALGYKVTKLHRIKFGSHTLDDLPTGQTRKISHE